MEGRAVFLCPHNEKNTGTCTVHEDVPLDTRRPVHETRERKLG